MKAVVLTMILMCLVGTTDNVIQDVNVYKFAESQTQQEQALLGLNVKTPRPRLTFIQSSVDDTGVGNGNGILEPGETVTIEVLIYNMGTAIAWDVNGALFASEPGISMDDRTASFGDIYPGEIVSSSVPHFQVTLDPSVPCGKDLTLTLQLSATNINETIPITHAMRKVPDRDMAVFEEDSRIYGADSSDDAGSSVASGDLDGDGYDDLILGAFKGDGPGNTDFDRGEVWVKYGSASLSASLDLSSPPSNSTVIYGVDDLDYAGWCVSSGDLNGDGYDDLIAGVRYGDGPGNTGNWNGETWIIYGSTSLPSSIDLASPPSNTTVIYGPDEADELGYSVSCGDLNADGYDDLILGANHGDGPGNTGNTNGEIWIIYGSASPPSSIDLASPPSNTTVIYGPDENDSLGNSVSSGDLNGDGYDDLIAGVEYGDGPGNTGANNGEVWIIYGSESLLSIIDLASPPSNTMVVYGADDSDCFGNSVSSGDLNRDGYDDLILGANHGDGPGNTGNTNGEIWIIYGSASPPSSIDLASPPSNTTVIYGPDENDSLGNSVFSGDLNGDGYDDLIAGAGNGNGPGNTGSSNGEVWVIYSSIVASSSIDLSSPPANTMAVYGADIGDYFGISVSSGDLNRDGYDDLIAGAYLADGPDNLESNNGEVAVALGKPDFHYYIQTESYSWIDATIGTDLNITCDTCCTEMDLGFSFEFYGQSYSSIWVCDDGYISFSPVNDPIPWNYCFPDKHDPNNIIGVFWDDLNPGQGGTVYALLEGTEPYRRLTIEWFDVPHYFDTGAAAFEITLFESSNQVLVQYLDTLFGSAADDGATATAGLENIKGITGQAYSCFAPNLTDGTAWRATPFGMSRLFNDDMESGLNGWTTTGLWHQEGAGCAPYYHSPAVSFYYGQNTSCDYDTGIANNGLLTSPSVSMDYYGILSHWFRKETDKSTDLAYIQIAEDSGPMSDEELVMNVDGVWMSHCTDISSHSSHDINLGFSFDTGDDLFNNYLGWMVDDVEIWGCDIYGSKAMKAFAYTAVTPVCETSSFLLDGTGTYAHGCSGLSYQWYEDGSPITGATTLQYVMPAYHIPGQFEYTLEVICTDPIQSDMSDPVAVQVVEMPVEVPEDSFMLAKISGGTEIHMTWTDVSGGETYHIYQDTDAAGLFEIEISTNPTGTTGVDIDMPTDSLMFYLVAAANPTCGEGPIK